MKKKYGYVFLILFVALVFSACSGKKSDIGETSQSEYPMDYGSDSNSSDGMLYDMDESGVEKDKATSGTTEGSESNGSTQNVSTNRKLIKKVYLELQTLAFTNTLNFVLDEVKSEGGYVENSNISGNEIFENSRRSASLIIRIPSEMTDVFVNLLGDNANVISKREETEDITKEFVDTESRIKMLQIEQERLLSFLEKAETLEDMITLEDRLGDVRYELEGYASTLKTYENLVDYSTINISIYEVKEIVTKVEKKSALTRMSNGLRNTFTNIKDGFTNFFVWFVINFPYFIIWGIIIIGGIFIGFKINKGYKAKLQRVVNGEVRKNDNVKNHLNNHSDSHEDEQKNQN